MKLKVETAPGMCFNMRDAQPLRFDEIPELQSMLEAYLRGPWAKWASMEIPRRKSISIYDKLFNLLQTIETEGAETALELVWGTGVALWQTDKHRVRYPLISHLLRLIRLGRTCLCASDHARCLHY
jgi:hypothetical protein